MKKLLLVVLCICTALLCVGCVKNNSETIDIYLPDGAPALSLAYMMENCKKLNGYDINYIVVPSNMIGSYVASDSADLAIMPTNAAANLFNRGKEIRLVSVNTFGNLYMVSSEQITAFEQLEGKVVAVIGQSQTPDLVLRHVLSSVGVETVESDIPQSGKIALYYVDSADSIPGLLVQGKVNAALLGEPAVTATINNIGVHIIFDLQEEWEKATGYEGFPQASLIATNAIPDSFITAFVNELEKGKDFVINNPDKAIQLIGENMLEGTEPSITALSEATAKRCNIGLLKASEAIESIEEFFKALGIEISGDGFFFGV